MVWNQSQIHALDVAQALAEQPGSGQQNGGQHHLRNNQPFSSPRRRSCRSTRTALSTATEDQRAPVAERASARKAWWWSVKAESQMPACGSRVRHACLGFQTSVWNPTHDELQQRHSDHHAQDAARQRPAERLRSTTGAAHDFFLRPVTCEPQFRAGAPRLWRSAGWQGSRMQSAGPDPTIAFRKMSGLPASSCKLGLPFAPGFSSSLRARNCGCVFGEMPSSGTSSSRMG